ncbi:PP2C family protein-serine/threonine phosphatase [Sphingomonas sanxanigenens]|uniref:PPM-type phosphatase domain-containing protein n=1 Tax=Sphingomonas sanxanigenens DSM 19645 = NX02 TaxID=1123269 RepID=W0AGK1_9SPHN|nr:protein phosphatase 2C domain-containing protein [Sphingomonas sanxanigenens]AHE57014.1 hypothetical protein NX02_27140 [Sphingomonas sanxanigenens DSM 19645 = NX02]
MSDAFELVASATTHPGRVRRNNEDAYCARPDIGLWAVADGMGGHEGGEFASSAIVEALDGIGVAAPFEAACRAVAEGIQAANARIHDGAAEGKAQMGSTVVALLARDGHFAVLWAGDSRAYLLRDGVLRRLTRDHTQVQALIERGILSEADAAGHPMSHVLARAVGIEPHVEIDVIVDMMRPDDVFLLCSDGLHGTMEENEIHDFLTASADRTVVDEMVARTLELGAPDNVTVVTVVARARVSPAMANPIETVE